VKRHLTAVVVYMTLSVAASAPALAEPFPASIPLPNDFAPEGIAVGAGSTFYAGSLVTGDIYRGSLRSGEGAIFIDAPEGRVAVGLKAERARRLLFVAGGATGQAYVYDLRTGADVATYEFAPAGAALLNDVIVTRDAAYFTDSFAPVLYKIPIGPGGRLGTGETLVLSGPAATIAAFPNLNGIEATANGSTLIVNHSSLGALFAVDPATGASAEIAVDGLIPGTPDGLLLAGRQLWVVQNFANTLVRVTLSPDLSSGTITAEITSPLFRVPTTVARHGSRLAAVNARFDLGLPPPFGPGAPPGTEFDVVLVRAH
jgi:sugar lactone lactonase YvrE